MRVTGFTKRSSFLLGVAGGSGSGKTFFAKALQAALGEDQCAIISQDNFYIDQSKNFDFDGGSVNFDHPDSIDFRLLTQLIFDLKRGQQIQIPIYDFVTHSRKTETVLIKPKPLIIVDGILILHPWKLRDAFDDMVFFDTPEDLRFQRRLERDIKERGREAEGVRKQFFNQVKPMHDQFVEPSKAHAHSVVKEVDEFAAILADYCAKMLALK
jgi:uridine kinase